jgi:hypothetical protein
MSQNLYFAYGSNLNLSDLNAWLERNGYSPDLLEFHSPASRTLSRLSRIAPRAAEAECSVSVNALAVSSKE